MKLNGWKRKVVLMTMSVVVVYSFIIVWFYFGEDSFVYFPRKGLHDAESFNLGIELVELVTPDSIKLVAWIIPAPIPDPTKIWFLYFHGNGGNISSRGYVAHYRALRNMGLNTFALGYRGYGLSDGSPGEQGLYLDALTAYTYLVNVRQVPPRNIFLFGYSLGAAVAVDLAAKVETAGIILEGAFTSAPNVGRDLYPFLPVSWLMTNRFDSIGKIQRVAEPKLFLHAVRDEIIPFDHGKTLYAAASEPKMFIETAGGHNTAHREDSSNFYGSIAEFLKQVKRSEK